MLQSLVHNRYPQVIGRDPASAKISVEGEDMLFALLGGQVDQRGVSPTQGNLMNPPMVVNGSQQSSHPLAGAHQNGNRGQSTSSSAQSMPGRKSNPQNAMPRTDEQANPFMHMGYDTSMWTPQMMALPVVAPLPCATPADGYQNSMPSFNAQADQRPHRPAADAPHGQNMGQIDFDIGHAAFSNEDLWARLQTFYEPTPAYWGQSVQGIQPGYQTDYSGMAMGM